MFEVTFTSKEQIADNIYSFNFAPAQPIRYIAGQFTEIKLTHNNPDDRGEKRWFTLSGAPSKNTLSITTRISSPGSSFKQALFSLPPGTKLMMANPMGDFVLPKDKTIPLLFVAGGIGCTPFHSIIEELNLRNEKRNIKMIYSANRLKDVAFTKTFESLGNNFEICLTSPPENWDGKSGRITAEDILEASDNNRHIYISGPEPMVETLDKELKELGVPANKIHGDFFPGYQPI